MRQCLSCKGVVPASSVECPNCAVSRKRGLTKAVVLGGTIALASGCLIATPVYGIPCTSKQVDGGTQGCFGECTTLKPDGGDPRKDPSDPCFTDGGTP